MRGILPREANAGEVGTHRERLVPVFSRRTDWPPASGPWLTRLQQRRAEGAALLDLTSGNPTAVGLGWDEREIAAALAAPGLARHEPDAAGRRETREAISRWLGSRGRPVPATDLLLTASTSESHSLLLRVLCDPGDEVVLVEPGYPLIDVVAQLEALERRAVRLRREPGRWSLDVERLADVLGERARAVLVVHPNNPTGSRLSRAEADALAALCAERELALVSDEVFADFAWEAGADAPATLLAAGRERGCLTAALGGLSKSCGLPQLKLAWIALGGDAALIDEARRRLEIASDTFLSASTPVQLAAETLLERSAAWRERAMARIAANREAMGGLRGLRAAPGEGGWHAVIEAEDERPIGPALVAALGDGTQEGVIVQPGDLFDLPDHAAVVSLITQPDVFARGLRILETRLA